MKVEAEVEAEVKPEAEEGSGAGARAGPGAEAGPKARPGPEQRAQDKDRSGGGQGDALGTLGKRRTMPGDGPDESPEEMGPAAKRLRYTK